MLKTYHVQNLIRDLMKFNVHDRQNFEINNNVNFVLFFFVIDYRFMFFVIVVSSFSFIISIILFFIKLIMISFKIKLFTMLVRRVIFFFRK